MLTLAINLGVLLLIIIFFLIPWSPFKNVFLADAERLRRKYAASPSAPISEDDIRRLPDPVQRYFRYCGFVGASKMSGMKAEFHRAAFKQETRNLTIDYTQYNFIARPQRLAFIKSRFLGIPFDGYDRFEEGRGSMRGIVAKLFTIFNQKGPEMDKSSLVTFLSECLLLPSAALQEYITWTPVDATHAKAALTFYDITVEGVFTFGGNGEMLSFTTKDRAMTSNNGRIAHHPWTITCGSYKRQNSFMVPTATKAIWNLPEGDLVYFDSDNTTITYF